MRPKPNASPGGTQRRFIFSDISEEDEVYYKRKIEELGGVVESIVKSIFVPHCTHVIAKRFMLTEKVLCACAGGKWVLRPEYLIHSNQLGYWADETDFEWHTTHGVPKICRLHWNKTGRGVFAGYSVYVKLRTASHTKSFRRILAVGGADILPTTEASRASIAISDVECLTHVRQAVGSGTPIVNIAYIKDAIFFKIDPANVQPYLLDSPVEKIKGSLQAVEEGGGRSPSQGKRPLSESNNNSIKKICPSLEKGMYTKKHEVSPLQNTLSSAPRDMKRKCGKIPFTPEKYASILDFFPKESKEKFFCIKASNDQDGDELDLTHNDIDEAHVEHRDTQHGVGRDVSVDSIAGNTVNTSSNGSFIISAGGCGKDGGTKDRDGNEKDYGRSAENTEGNCKRMRGQTDKRIENDCGKGSGDHDKMKHSALKRKDYRDSNPCKNFPKYVAVHKDNKERCVEEHSLSCESGQRCLETKKPVSLDREVIVKVRRLEEWLPVNKLQSMLSPTKPSGLSLGTYISQKLRNSLLTPRTINRDDMKRGIMNFLRKSKIQDNTYCGLLPSVRSGCNYSRDEVDSTRVSITTSDERDPAIRELTLQETSYYESCLDHHLSLLSKAVYREDGIISQGIDTLRLCLTTSTYPPAHIMGNFFKTLVFETKFTLIHYQALGLAHQMLMLHPPGNQHMKLYYLKMLEYNRQEERQRNHRAWSFVDNVLTVLHEATDVESEAESLSCSSHDPFPIIHREHALNVLRFLVLLFKEDMKQFTSGNEVRQLLMWHVFLGRAYHLSNATPPIKQLLNKWKQMLSAPLPLRQCISQLVTLVVEMAWRFGSSFLLPTSPLPLSLDAISNELLICLKDSGPSVTVQLIRELPSPWIKSVISSIIFQEVTKSNNVQIFLRDIVDFYVVLNTHQKTKSLQNKENGRLPVVKIPGLSKIGPHNVNKQNTKGETVLMRACMKNDVERVRLLMSVPGLNINLGDHLGWTALHEAAVRGHEEVVKCLLNFNCYDGLSTADTSCSFIKRDYYKNSINAQARGGEDKRTPLHDAVQNGHIGTAKLLLEYGGNALLEDEDKEGNTALDLAESSKMRKLLEKYRKAIPSTGLGKPLIFLSALSSPFGVLPSHTDRSEFAVSFANSHLEVCGYRSIIYSIKKDQKRRKRLNSPSKANMHSLTDSHSEKSGGSDLLSDSYKCSPKSTASSTSLPPEASISEETLENEVEKYIELDMKTHIDFIQVKQTLPQDMEGLEYLMYLFL